MDLFLHIILSKLPHTKSTEYSHNDFKTTVDCTNSHYLCCERDTGMSTHPAHLTSTRSSLCLLIQPAALEAKV